MHLVKIQEKYDQALAQIVRDNLKAHGLAIPGTAYFDPALDHMSHIYLASPLRDFFVALDENEQVIGGVGLDHFAGLDHCAELQKLYLADCAKGRGYGYELVARIKKRAVELGYRQMYLETHHNLTTAIHLYEKTGFRRIDRLPICMHNTMDVFFVTALE